MIYGLDPGTRESALVALQDERVYYVAILSNAEMESELASVPEPPILACELIGHFGTGMHAGKDVFETCFWMGRFLAAWGGPSRLIDRRKIKAHLCGTVKAKDKNVRQALLDLDRWPRAGGGAIPQVGTKDQPGPLYGMKTHLWSALAVAVTYQDLGDAVVYTPETHGLVRAA